MDQVAAFTLELQRTLEGTVDASKGTRARYSTDAGNYRVVPLVVAHPASKADVEAAMKIARRHHVPVTTRGGGTSCAGNAVGTGLILDFSTRMNRVLDIDPDQRTARVQPGCVESTLQQAAGKYGLRFGPDPSSQNRCTIGGMVGNNACGPHATAWGRTSSNIVELECIDGTGRHFTARTEHALDLPEVPGLAALIDQHLAEVRTQLGRFGRQVSGYSLEHLTPERHRNLAAMLVGTEGTLVTVVEIVVKLVPVPTSPVLVALGYADMIAAADDVPALLKHHPLAIEGLDHQLVDVVRRHKGPGAVPDLPAGNGWLLCEVGGKTAEDSLRKAHALAAAASTQASAVYPPGDDAVRLWRIRADGAGLGGRTPVITTDQAAASPAFPAAHGSAGSSTGPGRNPETSSFFAALDSSRGPGRLAPPTQKPADTSAGNEQAWPGFEDAAVPPEHLGSYLRDFTALMQKMGIHGLLYGHFGDGCVHVRLDLPLESMKGVETSRTFLERAAQICADHGGSISGEHGDGRARTELLHFMYSAQILDLFNQVKTIFDPENLMNPGILATPAPVTAPLDPLDAWLRRPQAKRMSYAGGFHFTEDHGDFTTAVHRCTGVGKCRASIPGTFMCPSYAATGDEKDVTRGRARILEEATNGRMITSLSAPEVAEALDLCLACKACTSDCPAGVDMAKYRSEALFRRFRGRLRPFTHYTLGWLPRWTWLTARVPGLAALGNLALSIKPLRELVFETIGLAPERPMPHLQSGTFQHWAMRHAEDDPKLMKSSGSLTVRSRKPASRKKLPHVMMAERGDKSVGMTLASGHKPVVVWADSFSQTLDDTGARDMVRVLEANGFSVIIPEPACCGLTWITTGQLSAAKKRLRHLLAVFAPFAAAGIPIVGVEPSCTAVLRDDLLDLLPKDRRSAVVSHQVFTLAELLALVPASQRQLPDLTGVEVVAQPHCHHYSVMGWAADRKLLKSLGAKVTELSGCCGLAGNFGMESGHFEVSKKVAALNLLPTLKANPSAVYLADGFSCRTQAEQLAGRSGKHLATLLADEA